VATALTFSEARRLVIETVSSARPRPAVETLPLSEAFERILAADARADRDYPPLARSIRDGIAVRAADLPGELEIVGEIRAGQAGGISAGPRQAVEIMTGAPVPDGADTIVMIEHVTRDGNRVRTERVQQPGDFIQPAGAEARGGQVLVRCGEPLTFSRIAMLATIGCVDATVFSRPRVAILATGDEIVEIDERPEPFQVRNSNTYSLASQVRRSGGEARILPVARDEYAHTRALIELGLEADLLLLSGGVSAGKYDIVEHVLADLGAEFLITRVKIQPGQPLVFGRARGKFFFGLPGNPASTMVTFELFARAAIELLGGRNEAPLPLLFARLTSEFRHKPGLTRFLPARLHAGGFEVTPVPWTGSSDVPALARANAFLVADAERERWETGELIPVLLQ
jgi:molybdopterin molybdotransferase